MDLHADSEPEVIAISTSDVESTPNRAGNAKPFVKLFSFLPSLLRGRFQTSGTKQNLGAKALVERALTRVVMEVLGKVLLCISASPTLGNHPIFSDNSTGGPKAGQGSTPQSSIRRRRPSEPRGGCSAIVPRQNPPRSWNCDYCDVPRRRRGGG
ncbi:hypothetical protein C8R45DRAFT_1023963, partial [Mycena sanguinolenta]